MREIVELLKKAGINDVKENEPLSKHTTMKIGGPAEVFVEPQDADELQEILRILHQEKMPWRVIGRGSNLLVLDEGIKGVVIKLGKGMDHLEQTGTEVTVGGGFPIIKLATVLSREGLSGLEFAGGIPGSVGGAVYMNAGAHGSDMSKILKKARIVFNDGSSEWLTNEEMEFSYRTSVLQLTRPGICVEAVLSLSEGDKEQVTAEMQKHKDYRRDTQPWNYPCAGSIFRNPLPNHAGKLVEDAGLKGHQIGGAQVSDLHGNFIVNTGDATAKDVLDLIAYIQRTILEAYSVKMETEVEIIGETR
ncbi:UDP-N-acetylmuramate dehydrogenase [Bacillus solimangrovi]|uniref:UDP-N-acetylenolpyruvoylglucosamine reductase n=1 Tax=Bacillus solimangrovi TaxID=1305675 RepID=A0A1E5LAQ1_9BACI|nr:UDP-N-acetylmuramate dehydrogenase [Bacillus solimangrovi]OEH91170.1 UDP-N-acetylenolpyruvoylglucosamine reductase [Bacillus solimangrovi]